MQGEVRQPNIKRPAHDRYDGGLRDRSADVEPSCTLAALGTSEDYIHGVPSDVRAQLRAVCQLPGTQLEEFTRAP